MKLFLTFLGAVFGVDPCLSGESQPNYGGSCWNKWGSVEDIELWAAENCGENNCDEGAELTGLDFNFWSILSSDILK